MSEEQNARALDDGRHILSVARDLIRRVKARGRQSATISLSLHVSAEFNEPGWSLYVYGDKEETLYGSSLTYNLSAMLRAAVKAVDKFPSKEPPWTLEQVAATVGIEYAP